MKIRKKEDRIVINTRNETQQKLIIEKLNGDNRFECKLPTKLIPVIMIKRISKKLNEDEILNEICSNEGISKEKCTIKLLPSHPTFRTNRAILKCTKEDTIKIRDKNEVKIGFMIHPISMIYNVIQCYGCHGFNHFEYNKDKTEKTCNSTAKCGFCASEQHKFKDCPVKNNTKEAKCCNCNGNHPSNSRECPKRKEVFNKIKIKYIC